MFSPKNHRKALQEYQGKKFTGCDIPMELYFNKRRHSFSTTELRGRVLAAEASKAVKITK